jgi:type IV secretory pathway TraG/TraD family ATPase VirD4
MKNENEKIHPFDLLKSENAKGTLRKSRKLHIGKVVNIEEPDNMKTEKFHIKNSDRAGHLGVLGTTRIGKTRLLEHLITQDIKAGHSVIMIDPKGDSELFSKIIETSVDAGRLNDIIMITPIYPKYSSKIDPLAYYYMEDELVDHVISGIKAKEEYFINVASEISSVVISGLIAMAKAQGEKLRLNFNDIKIRSTHPALKKFSESLQLYKNHGSKEISETIEEVVSNIEHILDSPPDFFSKVSSSLRTTLTALTSSTTGRIIGKAYTNEFVKRFEQGRRIILICNTGSLLARRTAYIMGRVLVSMIQSTVGRFFASGRKIDPPLCLYVDEGHNILYKGIQELFNKAGGAGVWINFFTQSVSQMEEEIGKEATQSIMDNINTWIFMKVNHERTAQLIEDMSPLRTKREPYLHFDGGDIRISLRENQERLILKERALSLKPRWFYLKSQGRIYKGFVPHVSKSKIEVQYPQIKVV